ncbi:MAG TPA: alpha-2-macroglobulin family protein [Flavipsychrobacter sp.]|nr:alpha-2-macroglobulin family protein [Flavipsychrobacter sp.]
MKSPCYFRLFLVFLLFAPFVSLAQSYRFKFDQPREIPFNAEMLAVYSIPADSVEHFVYGKAEVSLQTPWIRKPVFVVAQQKIDSVFRSASVAAGYYLIIEAKGSFIHFSIRRKEAFFTVINDLRDLLLLEVRQADYQPLPDAVVKLDGKLLPFDKRLRAFVLDIKDGGKLEIRKGNDVEFYTCSKKRFKPYHNNNYNSDYSSSEIQVAYKGYLVTNKPKYLPGDTVKYKAYLLNAATNEPIREGMQVTLGSYPEFKIHTLKAQAPGVYYSEFVLGDSVRPDRDYELWLTGNRSGARFSQQLRVEDYLLDETYLRVTGENLRNYQPGDSVNLYAFAYNSNSLPVLDGTISITVTPQYYTLKPGTKMIYVPDTIYHTNVPVNPEGDTYIGFSTKEFPDLQQLNLNCAVRLTNSNFETKDTNFTISYNAQTTYLKVSEAGDTVKAELIRNKKSIAGKGYYSSNGGVRQPVSYPFETTVDELQSFFHFYQTDDTGGIINEYQHSVYADSIVVLDDYRADTAYLQVINPKNVWFRYTLYRGNNYIGNGTAEKDTLIKIRSKKGETFTMLINYTWAINNQSKTATAFKISKRMQIDVKKKDIIYPGQTDTIGIHLRDIDGVAVKNTNVTVLAFTSKFQEDHVPQLAASGFIKPGLGDVKFVREVLKQNGLSEKPPQWITRPWAKLMGADTCFYYKNIHFNDSNIALYSFKIPDSAKTQLAIYIREGANYVQPQAIYNSMNRPLYAFMLSVTTDFNALLMEPGEHNLLIRTKDSLYNIRKLVLVKGYKTNLFINADKLTQQNDTLIKPFVSKMKMPDSLDSWERDAIAKSMFLYRSEKGNMYRISQGDIAFDASRGVGLNLQGLSNLRPDNYYEDNRVLSFGPVNYGVAIDYFAPGYMKQQFIPELHFIYTLRPDMLRLERYDFYQLLRGKLQVIDIIPQVNKLTTVAKPYYELVVSQPAKADETKLPYKEYVIKEHRWQKTKEYSALLELRMPPDRHTKSIAIHPLDDTLQPYVLNAAYGYSPVIFTKAGRYKILVIWNDSTSTSLDNIYLKALGRTILNIAFDSTRFEMKHPPDWFKESVSLVKYDTTLIDPILLPIMDGKGYGGVSGTVFDEREQPVPGAIVEVTQNGVVKGGIATDADGKFSIDSLEPGYGFILSIKYTGYAEQRLTQMQISANRMTYQHFQLEVSATERNEVIVRSFKTPQIRKDNVAASLTVSHNAAPPMHTYTSNQISKMATVSTQDIASLAAGSYQSKNGALSLGGGQLSSTAYIVDGIQVNRADATNRSRDDKGNRSFMRSENAQKFMADFLSNLQAASGLRKEFRDWAIWEPNLWTDKDGNTSFTVKYPDDITSWKTYVLTMNPKGFSGSTFRLTRSFKPLSAELSAPRFLRYGDTVEMVGKVMNYSGKPFRIKTIFSQRDKKQSSDTLTIQNARVEQLLVAAPSENTTDTADLPIAYSITTDMGYSDGEERSIPVFPVGVTENKGQFVTMMHDTSFSTKPSDTSVRFTGKTTIHIDGSLMEVMLREIENLIVYPHGCTEQLTTKLLAIYYEEEVKKLLGNTTLNNKKAKKKIVDQLIAAQHTNGSFGWFAGNYTDYRITNYVISTLSKVNKNGWLDLIIRRGLGYLNENLTAMDQENKLASLATLSQANYASNYKAFLDSLKPGSLSLYNRFAIVKIRKQQQLPYRQELDTLVRLANISSNGMSWGTKSYDWFRNELATTLLAYQAIADDSVYSKHKDAILQFLLFQRKNGYYGNTAESGLVLTTLLPEMLKDNKDSKDRPKTTVKITGTLNETITSFPAYFVVKDKTPQFNISKQGFSPAYVSVVYEYFNTQPRIYVGAFKVKSHFVKNGDTVTSLKQGEKAILRVNVQALKDADYVMIEIPIPAGCVQADKKRGDYYYEANRENYKDRTVIYFNNLRKGNYSFDVELAARYKGKFNLNPANASMMYFPEEYGNEEVKKLNIR